MSISPSTLRLRQEDINQAAVGSVTAPSQVDSGGPIAVPGNSAVTSRTFVICVAGSAEDRIKLSALVARNVHVVLVSSPDDVPALLEMAPAPSRADSVVVLPQLRLDSDRHVATWFGREVSLTPLEFDLLACLLEYPGRMWRYELLHEHVWHTPYLGNRSDIHSLVKRLRAKLSKLDPAVVIEAIRGVGFRLEIPPVPNPHTVGV